MKKTITIDFQNSSGNLRNILSILEQCREMRQYSIIAQVNSSNIEAVKLAKQITFCKVKICENTTNAGPDARMYEAFNNAFEIGDFNMHIGMEMLPTYDCLAYVSYCCEMYRDDPAVLSVSTSNDISCKTYRSHDVSRRPPIFKGVFGIWVNRWQWIKNSFMSGDTIPLSDLTNKFKLYELCEIYPLLSRASGNEQPASTKVNSTCLKVGAKSGFSDAAFFEAGPLVTAVMITGMHPKRYPFARVAVECFRKQSYRNKELLIINHGTQSLATGDARIREIRVIKGHGETVGDLRNLGLKYALGKFIMNWDDDDWHHPQRIEKQLLAQKGDAPVFLKHRINYSFKNNCALYNVTPQGGEATILHPKAVSFCYPSLLRGSDTIFANYFKKRITIDNDPILYVRFFHGLNLWDHEHVMRHLADRDKKNIFEINPEHRRYLAKVLRHYGFWSNGNGNRA